MSKRKLEAAQFAHKKHKIDTGDDNVVENGGMKGQKQRTLIFANRGISGHGRHLMKDLRELVPACKKESKLGTKGELHVINEMCEVAACNNCVFFEQRGNDLFMWVSKAPNGPSVKFLVLNSINQTFSDFTPTSLLLLISLPKLLLLLTHVQYIQWMNLK
jgi:ribosome biogenesis protein BRX1